MKVIAARDEYSGKLGSALSTKFVRSWRKKTRKFCDESGNLTHEEMAWIRRSRLVAREYNWLESREDIHCEVAFLQVAQPVPRVVKKVQHHFNAVSCVEQALRSSCWQACYPRHPC